MALTITYVRRARKHGANHALAIIRAARIEGVPLSVAFALVEQESGFRNIFGHDPGGMFPGQRVTKARCEALLWRVRHGGVSNGVGLTQLTWSGYLEQAEKLGGPHRPYVQCRVGFRALASLHREWGNWHEAFMHYNGSGPAAVHYADVMTLRVARWHHYLTGE